MAEPTKLLAADTCPDNPLTAFTQVTAPAVGAPGPLAHSGLETKKLLPPTSLMPPLPTRSPARAPVIVLMIWFVAPLKRYTAPMSMAAPSNPESTTT